MRSYPLAGSPRRLTVPEWATNPGPPITRRPPTKGEELAAQPSCYERARLCQRWAEEYRDKYLNGRVTAREGRLPAPGDRRVRKGDAFTREYGWKSDLMAKDFVSLEQLYRAWSLMYYAQVTAEATLVASGLREPGHG